MRVAVLVAALACGGAATKAESLSDALATAYRNSGLIEQNRALLRAADEDVAQAVATLRPVFGYAVSAGYSNPAPGDDVSLSASLNADWLLYDFGGTALRIEALKEIVLSTRAVLTDLENAVLLNAVRAYLSVRRAEAFVQLRQNNVRLLTEQLRATRDRFDVGEVTRTDVSLAEAALAAARSGLAAEQGNLARAQEFYKTAVGVRPGRLAPPPALPAIPGSEAAAKTIALRENPSIDEVRHRVAAAELSVEAAERALYPSLNATGSLSIDDDGDDQTRLGLALSGPIHQGGRIASTVRQAQARRDAARAQLYSASLEVEQEVGEAYANLAVSVASIDAFDRQVRAAQLALEGVREELQLGARTTLDVLDQEQEVLDARTSRVSAEVDRYLAVYQILDATGLLTAERLGLAVPVYDPAAYYNAVKDAPGTYVSPEGKRLDRVMRALGKR